MRVPRSTERLAPSTVTVIRELIYEEADRIDEKLM